MPAPLPDPLYYLNNFRVLLDWVRRHHEDLLSAAEQAFIDAFPTLPQAAQALLVRMVMRKGAWFRADKLKYAEIGDTAEALGPLLSQGWVCEHEPIALPELFRLLTRAEIQHCFAAAGLRPQDPKDAWLDALRASSRDQAMTWREWRPGSAIRVVHLCVNDLSERLRLLFFGNLRQDWTEFVLADLGIYRYESVPLRPEARVFTSRQDVDDYLHLHRCRERLHESSPDLSRSSAGPEADVLQQVADAIPRESHPNAWLERRRGKLLMQLGALHERSGAYASALEVYRATPYPGARARTIRMLELTEQHIEALTLAEQAHQTPQDEAELQQLHRMLPRLRRRAGAAAVARDQPYRAPSMVLAATPSAGVRVEQLALDLLHTDDAPVYYVENTLFNGLFGLLFWDAVFEPAPGAFFHPFQAGPADLYSPDFADKRGPALERGFAQLRAGAHVQAIRDTYNRKQGIQSPFVAWGTLDASLLEQALACIEPRHLEAVFRRLLTDLRGNRAGFPDLIQFWPAQKRYRLIEVKSPGDKLQDSQKRWLAEFQRQGIAAVVCHLQWQEPA